jgi:hypothetical protein
VLALVVDDTAPVIAALLLGQAPGREARFPARIEPADDVAVAVAEDRPQGRVLDPLGIQERPLRTRLRERPAFEAKLLQRGFDFTFKLARKLGRTLRILAFRRNCHATGEVLLELA